MYRQKATEETRKNETQTEADIQAARQIDGRKKET